MSSNPNQQDPLNKTKTTTDGLIKTKPKKGIQAEIEDRKGQQLHFRKFAGKK
jgi:hypothetical protein